MSKAERNPAEDYANDDELLLYRGLISPINLDLRKTNITYLLNPEKIQMLHLYPRAGEYFLYEGALYLVTSVSYLRVNEVRARKVDFSSSDNGTMVEFTLDEVKGKAISAGEAYDIIRRQLGKNKELIGIVSGLYFKNNNKQSLAPEIFDKRGLRKPNSYSELSFISKDPKSNLKDPFKVAETGYSAPIFKDPDKIQDIGLGRDFKFPTGKTPRD